MKAYRGIIQIECGMKVCPEDHARRNVVATCEACIHAHNAIVDLVGMPLIKWQTLADPEPQPKQAEPIKKAKSKKTGGN